MDSDPGRREVVRALLVLTALRVALFLAVLVPVRFLLPDPLLEIAVAFLVSAVVGVPLLSGPRRRLAERTADRAARRRTR